MRHSQHIVLSALQLLSVSHSASVPGLVSNVLRRDDASCPGQNLLRCPDKNLPSNFCCPPSSSCLSLDDSRTLICCPNGSDCTSIKTITCDIQRQNVAIDPSSLVKTVRLTDPLTQCGSGCCPHGYGCFNGNCKIMNKNPLSSATSTSAALRSTSTSTSSTTAETPVHTPNTDVSPCQAPGCPSFPGGAVAAGFFPGLIAGLLLGLAFYFLQKRRANRTPAASSKPGPFRQRSDDNMILHISDPIPSSAQGSIRTDFLRHQGSSENSPKSRSIRARASTRVKSLFAPKLTITVPDASTMPITPPQQIYPRTQQTMESIRVYSPIQLNEGTARPSRNINETNFRPPTTFSQMMERVGFQNPRGSPRYQVGEPEQQQAQKRFYQNEHTLRPGI